MVWSTDPALEQGLGRSLSKPCCLYQSRVILEVCGAARCAVGCCGFSPEHFLLQSVSALLDKFKKSDQVFDINAERDSDVEDGVPALSDDDFNTDSPGSIATEKIGEFVGNKSLTTVCESKKCKRYQVRESSQCEAEEVHF